MPETVIQWCLFAGIFVMGLERIRLWEMHNPDAVFAFGAGLTVPGVIIIFRRIHAALWREITQLRSK